MHACERTSAPLRVCARADKNPVLTEVATEVTKLINEAVAAAERRKTGGSASGSSTAATSAGGAA